MTTKPPPQLDFTLLERLPMRVNSVLFASIVAPNYFR